MWCICGEGSEFEVFVDYELGMDCCCIDWKSLVCYVWFYVKEYEVECNN